MFTRIFFLAVLLCTSIPFISAQTILKIDKSASQLSWTGRAAVGTYKVQGTLGAKSGTFKYTSLTNPSSKVVVDMKQLRCDNKEIEKNLKSGNFFDVKKHPEAVFMLYAIAEDTSTNNFIAEGALQIKEIEKEITFPITMQEQNGQVKIEGQLSFDRTEFGVTYGSPNFFENLGDQAISDTVELNFILVFE